MDDDEIEFLNEYNTNKALKETSIRKEVQDELKEYKKKKLVLTNDSTRNTKITPNIKKESKISDEKKKLVSAVSSITKQKQLIASFIKPKSK